MTKASWTPGPWSYHIADNAPVPHIAIEDEATNRLADVYYGAKGRQASATAEANARVMVAAPDLVEALWSLLRWSQAVLPLLNEIEGPSFKAARAALAKAEGRAP